MTLKTISDPELQPLATAPRSASARRAIPIADVRNPLLRKGLEVWLQAKGERRLPAREQITPRAMATILRHTALVRVIGDAEDFEFRIVGDAIEQAKGISYKGMRTADIDGVAPGYGTTLCGAYRRVCESREPAAFASTFERALDRQTYFQESICLPLGNDHETVDHLLVMGVYAPHKPVSGS